MKSEWLEEEQSGKVKVIIMPLVSQQETSQISWCENSLRTLSLRERIKHT